MGQGWVAHLIRLCAFLQNDTILLISKARGPLAPPGPACRVPSSILGRKSLAKGLPTLQLFPSWEHRQHTTLSSLCTPWHRAYKFKLPWTKDWTSGSILTCAWTKTYRNTCTHMHQIRHACAHTCTHGHMHMCVMTDMLLVSSLWV